MKAKAMLWNKIKYKKLNIETMLYLFDVYIAAILNYGCEVWGLHPAQDIEKVHTEYLKNILGVRKSTSNVMLYFELGRCPLLVTRKLRMFRYWCIILKSDNCILKATYDCMLADMRNRPRTCKNWAYSIKNELYSIGLGEYWDSQYIPNDNSFLYVVKTRLNDIFIQLCYATFESSSKCLLYKHLVDNFCLQYYLTKRLDNTYKSLICKYRISAHSLLIEKGRYVNTLRHRRLCTMCDRRDIEDEYHFILICPLYRDIRLKYIKTYYYKRPSMLKLVQLLSVQNVKSLNNLAKYLNCATKRRDQLMA